MLRDAYVEQGSLFGKTSPALSVVEGGADFACVVGTLAGCELPVPAGGWGSEGVALGSHGLVEWATLDAQWFALAQRRRRVFAVLDTGNWTDRAPILLEPDSLRGDSPPRREAWEGTAAGVEAGALDGGPASVAGAGTRDAWPADVACTLNAAFGSKQGLEDQHALGGGNCSSLAFGGNNTSGPIPVATAVSAHGGPCGRLDFGSETFITQPAIPTIGGGFDDVDHTLRADGFDASEDGTGRGTPLVPVATCYDTTHITSPGNWSNPQPGDPCHPLTATAHVPLLTQPVGVDVYNGAITGEVAATMGTRGSSENATGLQVLAFAQNQRDEVREMEVAGALAAEPGMKQQTYIAFSCKDHGADAGDIAPTLRSMGHDGSHANAGGQVAVAFDTTQITSKANYSQPKPGDPCHPLAAGAHPPAVAFGWQNSSQQGASASASEHVSPTLDKSKVPAVGGGAMAVRRLTPVECERLQGAVDDWTLVPSGPKRKPMADGPRYKMLGNSFAVTCVRWIGVQIQRAMRESSQQEAA